MIDNKVQFLLGVVEDPQVEKDTTIITFSIPFIMENMSQYPKAYPIGNHSHKLSKGDSVLITRVNNFDQFFYQPLDFSRFTGIKQDDDNYIQIKEDGTTMIHAKKKIEVVSDDVINITAANTVNINGEGTAVNINGGSFELKVANKTIMTVNDGTITINTNGTLMPFCSTACFMTGATQGFNSAQV